MGDTDPPVCPGADTRTLGKARVNVYNLKTSARPAVFFCIFAMTWSRSGTPFSPPSYSWVRADVFSLRISTTSRRALISVASTNGCRSQRSSRREPIFVRQRFSTP